jgi:hypothetical protein
MKKTLVVTSALILGLSSSAFAGNDSTLALLDDADLALMTAGTVTEFEPGQNGQVNALGTPGFAKAAEATGRGIVMATYLIGNKGRGNGGDPALGLDDHDPGVVGGAPDTTR